MFLTPVLEIVDGIIERWQLSVTEE